MSIEILEQLRKAVLDYDRTMAVNLAKKAIEEGISCTQGFNALTDVIRQVGDDYDRGDLWLPDLVSAANVMEGAKIIFEEELQKEGAKLESQGTVVIGTVYGDIHDIGKAIVRAMLTASGFTVYDIGIDVPAEKFVEEVKDKQPDILAMSALLTTTAPDQRKVIELLKKEGLRDKVKIMVGGGAITQEFSYLIGADGYGPTAASAVNLALDFLGKK